MATEIATLRGDLLPHVEAVQAAARRTAAGVRDLGLALTAAKAACRHGEWLPFLAAAGVDTRAAQRSMRYARLAPECDNLTHLPAPSTLLAERADRREPAAPDPPALDDAVQREFWRVGFSVCLFMAYREKGDLTWIEWADDGRRWRLAIPGKHAVRYWACRNTASARYADTDAFWREFRRLWDLYCAAWALYDLRAGIQLSAVLGKLDRGLTALLRADPGRADALAWISKQRPADV